MLPRIFFHFQRNLDLAWSQDFKTLSFPIWTLCTRTIVTLRAEILPGLTGQQNPSLPINCFPVAKNAWNKSISKNVLPRSQKLRNWWNVISCRSSMQQVQPCGWPSCRDCFCAPWRPSRAEAKRLPGIGLASSSHVSFWTTKIGNNIHFEAAWYQTCGRSKMMCLLEMWKIMSQKNWDLCQLITVWQKNEVMPASWQGQQPAAKSWGLKNTTNQCTGMVSVSKLY